MGRLRLLVPDLQTLLRNRTRQQSLPLLDKLLNRAAMTRSGPCSRSQLLFNSFNWRKPQTCPAAALSMLAAGADPGSAVWLRADPVMLQADLNRVYLVGYPLTDLSDQEADQLVDGLQELFDDPAIKLIPVTANQWVLQLPAIPDCVFPDPDQARGGDLGEVLPRDSQFNYWRKLLNESQMLLHNHPLNRQRQAAGLTVVNSLWFWGAGTLPDKGQAAPPDILAGESELLRALARLFSLSILPLGELASATGRQTSTLAEFSTDPAATADQNLLRLEQNWLAPLINQLGRNRIQELALVTVTGHHFSLTPGRWKAFWRRHKPQPWFDMDS